MQKNYKKWHREHSDCNSEYVETSQNQGAVMPSIKNILVVDDNKVNRQILSKILSMDYNIIEAENGEDALLILREKYESISVILLDIVMPVLDGYEVLRQMREDANLSQIPVIVASGQNSEDAEVKALSLGANDYILKPYKPDIIKHRVSNTIYLRETATFVNTVQNDSLTGVYGKEYFYMQTYEILQNNPQKKYDLICFDVERFKLVNDMYGMQIGDKLLKHIGSTLKNRLKGYGICGRIGADEFACMVPHRNTYSNELFTDTIVQINEFSDHIKLNLVLRYGIYFIEDSFTPVNIMCDRASLAKESIKGKYDTYFAYYDDKIRQKLLDEQMIVSDMKTALTENQFKVYFQPKYDLKTEEIIGAEALVRWSHPVKGFMSPSEFIPLFEKNGFITDLDIYVWDQCCQILKAWKDKGQQVTPISVNVSRADIYNPQLSQILISMIRKYKLSPKYLHLEITETAYTKNPEQLIDTILKLKRFGFIIEMDDFGTGYSSLNMLSELPIDIIKMDIRFIQKEENMNSDKSVLSFIISLAKWMDLQVVAEGVETKEQVHLLQTLNCEYAQGYYYAKPMSEKQFEKYLLQSNIRTPDTESKEYKRFSRASKIKQQIMLVLDRKSTDYPVLYKDFSHQYSMEHIYRISEAIDIIHESKETIAVVMVSLSEDIKPEKMSELLNASKKNNIPLIVLYDEVLDSENEIMTMEISDYAARPYETAQLKLRVQNAIAFAKMEKFEQEKEINAAIIEMRKRAEHDVLTGLLNRAEFEVRIDNFFHNNDKPNGIFIILDVDNFKAVNDTFGHVIGDKALFTVGERLYQIFQETEIIARIGGDEFSVFIPFALSLSQLQEKMFKLCAPVNLGVENITLSCSAGVCFTPNYGITHKDLYKNADMALLAAKRQGKSTFEIYNKDMKLPTPSMIEKKTIRLLDNVSDAMFVCDAITSEIIYINETACNVIKKDKESCLNKRCYELFWDQCRNCDRCKYIDQHSSDFYEESTYLKDHITPVHIKARVEEWDERKVKVHYLQIGFSS